MPDSAETARAFIAVNIPSELHEGVVRIQSHLRYLAGASAIRWTRPEQFHLTLEFLGNVPAKRVPELIAAMQGAYANEAPLKLALKSAGCFPSLAKPSVVWLDVCGEIERLAELQRRIHENTRSFAERADTKEFVPHLTIGRVKNGCHKIARVFGKALEKEAKKIGAVGEWEAPCVHVMRSELTAHGAIYTELAQVGRPRMAVPC